MAYSLQYEVADSLHAEKHNDGHDDDHNKEDTTVLYAIGFAIGADRLGRCLSREPERPPGHQSALSVMLWLMAFTTRQPVT